MKSAVKGGRTSKNGVFWLIENELIMFPFDKSKSDVILEGISKSGNTYNHRKLWNELGYSKPYNYYPRGRVHVAGNGTARIYMNPNIGEKYVEKIRKEFCIEGKYRIILDYSSHYRCHIDKGWTAER